jgi:nitrogen regulatory protein PII
MKRIEAIVRPFKRDEITDALAGIGITGITVVELHGHGRQRGHAAQYRGAEYRTALVPKVRIEVVTDDAFVRRVVETIERLARTGEIGDGKIFIVPVDDCMRIRTGETGDRAL